MLTTRARCAALLVVASVGAVPMVGTIDAQFAGVASTADVVEPADRDPHTIVDYDVFGDSISAGFGVAPHLTWVAAMWFRRLSVEPPDVEHRFYNHAIEGQAIATSSFLSVDQRNSSLLRHLTNFFADPPRPTPIADRTVVITPSVNELVVSDQGVSGEARISKAVSGIRDALGFLNSIGVPNDQIILLPMPPIGLQFAAEHDRSAQVDMPLVDMIVEVNRRLGDVLDIAGYAALDPNNNGLATTRFFDGLSESDGLHLDADGHAALAASLEPVFDR